MSLFQTNKRSYSAILAGTFYMSMLQTSTPMAASVEESGDPIPAAVCVKDDFSTAAGGSPSSAASVPASATVTIPPVIPAIATDNEDLYQWFLEGSVQYRPTEESDASLITLSIGDLLRPIAGSDNPLSAAFALSAYLSNFGCVGKCISINIGYKKEKIPANEEKIEIWICPKFLVEGELATTASYLAPIMNQWKSPVGYFWTLGNDEVRADNYDFLVDMSALNEGNLSTKSAATISTLLKFGNAYTRPRLFGIDLALNKLSVSFPDQTLLKQLGRLDMNASPEKILGTDESSKVVPNIVPIIAQRMIVDGLLKKRRARIMNDAREAAPDGWKTIISDSVQSEGAFSLASSIIDQGLRSIAFFPEKLLVWADTVISENKKSELSLSIDLNPLYYEHTFYRERKNGNGLEPWKNIVESAKSVAPYEWKSIISESSGEFIPEETFWLASSIIDQGFQHKAFFPEALLVWALVVKADAKKQGLTEWTKSVSSQIILATHHNFTHHNFYLPPEGRKLL